MNGERPLRIGLFLIAFPQLAETFIVTKVLKLLEAGFDVQIFTLQADGDWAKFSVLDGRDDIRARVHAVPPVRPLGKVLRRGVAEIARAISTHPRSFAELARHTWKHRHEGELGFFKSLYEHVNFVGHELDILHVEFDYQALGIADLRGYLGCKLLLSARGTLQSSSTFARRPETPSYLFRYADGYHFISQFLEDNMRGLGMPEDLPSWHIEPAIDLSLFQPRPRTSPPGPVRIVSVGRLSWAKGYEFALDAVADLRARGVDFRYDIYGHGPYEEAVRFAIEQHGLQSHVRLAGTRRREEMPEILANADIMLHASLDEGFCNAVIEAQAMELPVVTSDAGGLPENVEDGVTGFVVSRRNARALADKLELLAGNLPLRRSLGAAGRSRARARFDLDKQAEAFVHLYRELAAMPARDHFAQPRPKKSTSR
jgi:colanic acid/amylovoran biosynthesis glycosyltransferase